MIDIPTVEKIVIFSGRCRLIRVDGVAISRWTAAERRYPAPTWNSD